MANVRREFTDEQMRQLYDSPHVAYVSSTTVRLTEECKRTVYSRMQKGEQLAEIFPSLGIDPDVLGPSRLAGIGHSLKKQAAREGWDDDGCNKTDQDSSPSKLSKKQLQQVEHRLQHLEAEVMFLKMLIQAREKAMGIETEPEELPQDLP